MMNLIKFCSARSSVMFLSQCIPTCTERGSLLNSLYIEGLLTSNALGVYWGHLVHWVLWTPGPCRFPGSNPAGDGRVNV